MFITRSSAKVLQVFVSRLTESFTLRELAKTTGMQLSLAHRALQPLRDAGIVGQDKHKHFSLHYKEHHETLSFVEYLRRDDVFKQFKELGMFSQEVISSIKEESFVLLLFGSAVQSKNPRDIDILLVLDDAKKIEFHEKFLHSIASNYALPYETSVIAFESVYEMLAVRDEKNVMNELLNKHIILYGAELFFRLLKRGRK